jgi:hypothetical protein
MKALIVALIGFSALLVPSTPAAAHHGSAVFDGSRRITLTGPLVEFRFVNPHVIVVIRAKDPSTGKLENWLAETFSAARLMQAGWSKNMMKPGDRITLVGIPVRSGNPRMAIFKIAKDGQELPMP